MWWLVWVISFDGVCVVLSDVWVLGNGSYVWYLWLNGGLGFVCGFWVCVV